MTNPSQNRLLWTTVFALPVLFVCLALLQKNIDARTRSASNQQEELLLRSPSVMKKLSLGYDPLLADIYWTRAIQYYGARVGIPGSQFDLLWPLLDFTTTLDPRFLTAYRFGAIFLEEYPPVGAGRSDLAIELVKRGIAANPDEWHLNSDLGFLYYWRLQDYQKSAAAYLEGSKNPKAPPWLKMMAARVASKGGSVETSRMIWSEIYQSTKDSNVRKAALENLRGLKAQDDEAHLDELAENYKSRFGHYPFSTRDLRDAGLLPGIPVDPDGLPYLIGSDGHTRLDPRSTVKIPSVMAIQPR